MVGGALRADVLAITDRRVDLLAGARSDGSGEQEAARDDARRPRAFLRSKSLPRRGRDRRWLSSCLGSCAAVGLARLRLERMWAGPVWVALERLAARVEGWASLPAG